VNTGRRAFGHTLRGRHAPAVVEASHAFTQHRKRDAEQRDILDATIRYQSCGWRSEEPGGRDARVGSAGSARSHPATNSEIARSRSIQPVNGTAAPEARQAVPDSGSVCSMEMLTTMPGARMSWHSPSAREPQRRVLHTADSPAGVPDRRSFLTSLFSAERTCTNRAFSPTARMFRQKARAKRARSWTGGGRPFASELPRDR
jgi:hypothetical protein